MMEKYVITLSRQFASMGRTVAQHMSRELGIDFYDRDIVEETAKRMGMSVPDVSKIDEAGGANIFTKRRFPMGIGLLSTQVEAFEVQSNIIRDLAAKKSCIIVGRCADSVLRDYNRCLNIFVYAPYEARVRNCTESLGMTEKMAKSMITAVDRARESYRLSFCEDAKTVLDHRRLLIDSSWLGPEKTAHLLCSVVREVFS